MSNLLTPVITDLGRDALMKGFSSPENYRFSQVALGDGGGNGYQPEPGSTSLKNELQRINVTSVVVQDSARLHITAVAGLPGENEKANPFDIREIGFYLQPIAKNGEDSEPQILFAVYATEVDAKPLLTKEPATELLLAFDLLLPDIGEGDFKFDKDSYLHLPTADQDRSGMVRLATDEETKKGEIANSAVTPVGLKVTLQEQTVSPQGLKAAIDALKIPDAGGGVGDTIKDLSVTGAVSFGAQVRQMINLWNASYGIGVQNYTQYFRSDKNFAWYKKGVHDNTELAAGKNGDLQMALVDGKLGIGTGAPKANVELETADQDGGIQVTKKGNKNYAVKLAHNNGSGYIHLNDTAGKQKLSFMGQENEIHFFDNGQIRSLDDNHRILFRRSENKMELREFGDIIFSPGSKNGKETAKIVMKEGGRVGLGVKEPTTRLDVDGVVRAQTFRATSQMQHRMYPSGPLIYQDIFAAVNAKAIVKLGNPTFDNTSHTSKKPWNGRTIIKFGKNEESKGNGALVTVPKGFDTVWIRVLGDRWAVVNAYFTDGAKEDLGQWAAGFRRANCISPDGSLSDSFQNHHQWLPIPVGRAGQLALIPKKGTSSDFWVSGLAFSQNPWGHATQSARGIHLAVNGGGTTTWADGWEAWNNDVLTKIEPNTNIELKVPVVANGKDKLLYIVEHNNNWNGCMHNGIIVNGERIERFISTYDNPFARHWNSKTFNRYIAAIIPAKLIKANSVWLSVQIDMMKQDQGIHFREIGTHDFDVPVN